jgi:hypothetical protein
MTSVERALLNRPKNAGEHRVRLSAAVGSIPGRPFERRRPAAARVQRVTSSRRVLTLSLVSSSTLPSCLPRWDSWSLLPASIQLVQRDRVLRAWLADFNVQDSSGTDSLDPRILISAAVRPGRRPRKAIQPRLQRQGECRARRQMKPSAASPGTTETVTRFVFCSPGRPSPRRSTNRAQTTFKGVAIGASHYSETVSSARVYTLRARLS